MQIPLRPTEDLLPDPAVLAASLALARGDTVGAGQLAQQVLTAYGFFDGKDARRLRATALVAAEGALAAGRPADAVDLARRARDIATVDSLAALRSAAVGEALLLEARALVALGDATGAGRAAGRARVALDVGAGTSHPAAVRAAQLETQLRTRLARIP
jgi:hypothetical protein